MKKSELEKYLIKNKIPHYVNDKRELSIDISKLTSDELHKYHKFCYYLQKKNKK